MTTARRTRIPEVIHVYDDGSTDTDDITHGRAHSIHVSLPAPRVFQIDGEEIGEARAFRVSMQPGALRVR